MEIKAALIIDDSEAVRIIIKKFLQKLGVKEVFGAKNGKMGIDRFKDLLKAGKQPLVFLDYGLPDTKGSNVLQKIQSLEPRTKIILTTARDRSEESIKDVLAMGTYDFVSKPVRFGRVQEVIETMKQEDATPEDLNKESAKFLKNIIEALKTISLKRLSEYSGVDPSNVLEFIKDCESKGSVLRQGELKEIACNRCDSVNITQIFHCPACNSSNFKQAKLAEHYSCGNVSAIETYENEKCPKCKKDIRVLGVDYRVMDNHYICNDCDEKFADLSYTYQCMKCTNAFKLEQAKWVFDPVFKYVIDKQSSSVQKKDALGR